MLLLSRDGRIDPAARMRCAADFMAERVFHPFTFPQRVAAAVALSFALLGSPGPVKGAVLQPAATAEPVFATALGRIAEIYVRPVELQTLVERGLRGLSTLDPILSAEVAGGSVRLQVAGSIVANFPEPAATDVRGWAGLLTRALERAKALSFAVRAAPPEALTQAVMDGIVGGLDGYSRYTGSRQATGERAQREGYGGVGITVDFVKGHVVVRSLLPKGPAARAGVRPGDLLTSIDRTPVRGLDVVGVRSRLRGASGSPITLAFTRGGSARRVTLRREQIVPETLTVEVADHVGVIHLDRFNAATAASLREAVVGLLRRLGREAQGLVLDLRGNPGGLLDQAVAVADLFMTRGPILSTEGRHPESRQRWDAMADDVAEGLPIVVLVDGRSASSAEVVAAALQDSGRGVVVGSSSFGKGTVQTVSRLPNGGELFLTWSRINTPAGYSLHRQGVQPTVCTSRGSDSPTEVLADLREGRGPSAMQISSWRQRAADDDEALRRLRDACPWREHAPDLDLRVARSLLADPSLYARALSASTGHAVAER